MNNNIIRMEAENIKRIKAINITPNGSLVVIGGKNAQGKTSTLDAIEYALGGKPDVDRPIRDGATKARVLIKTADYTVTRTFSQTGSKLVVVNAEGAPVKSPQAILDKMVGDLSFDPLSFSRQKSKDQGETLRKLVGIDFGAMDYVRKKTFDNRTLVNREVKALQAQVDVSPFDPDMPSEEVSMSEALEIVTNANENNSKLSQAKITLNTASNTVCEIKDEIEELKQTLTDKANLLGVAEDAWRESEEVLSDMTEIDVAPLTEALNQLEGTNAKIRANNNISALSDQLQVKTAESAAMTARINKVDSQKADMLSKADMPVDGLSFGEDGITFNGIPFNQCSGAEQLRISLAMGLAANPTLKVILIRDGSLLDEDSLKLVGDMAEEADAQVWIERVGEGEEVSVIISDGEVQA